MPNKNSLSNDENTNVQSSVLDNICQDKSLMQSAVALQAMAAKFGFDWPTIQPVFEKLEEEVQELKHEIHQAEKTDASVLECKKRLEDELGDVLFCCMNIARFLNVDPENALQSTNTKFMSRFGFIERHAAQHDKRLQDLSLEELDAIWTLAKTKGL